MISSARKSSSQLKNDYWCKGLSFAQTKRELQKQVEMITRYNNEL